ncbi:hypothetical protein BG547_03010 [Mannheimia haemolytica]|nr:hypothetical protein BG545_03005 [Mannheimia haemolytica]QEC11582.1 hypothetical protein BG547_03010 [Mannheimia haemolytica]QEC16411.1 hypothetical protein BG548_03010 [Mannheimia haemolytica]QEC28593.1 hypothetical protein BG549_03010 [Mannheimia haemolytica]QEC33439.1 hypothetical protein BG550_03010 [Mannheimia haemolytica]
MSLIWRGRTMDKQYNFTIHYSLFTIHYTDTRYNKNGQGAVSERNIIDAKNRFKASHPYAKIISCVRGSETYVARPAKANATTKSVKEKQSQPQESSSLSSMLLGAAVTAGVGFVANKWFSKKDNT